MTRLVDPNFRAARNVNWRRVGPLLAVGVLVAMVAGWAAIGGGHHTRTASPSSSTGAAITTGKGSIVPQTPALQKDPSDPDWLTAAPQHISWQRVDGVPLPFSASDGPSRISGAVASGYSDTPQGAVMAAVQISFRLAWSPDFASVVQQQTDCSDATRQQLIDARSKQPLDPAMVAQVATAPRAFKVGAFSLTSTTLYLAFQAPDKMWRFARSALVWADGDWKYSDQFDDSVPDLPSAPTAEGFTQL